MKTLTVDPWPYVVKEKPKTLPKRKAKVKQVTFDCLPAHQRARAHSQLNERIFAYGQ